MRLASFNVNSIRRRVPHLARFLARHEPDLVFLQELKCKTEEFPALELAGTGYRIHALGQTGGRNGVAVLGRVDFEVIAEHLPGEDEDTQARFLAVRAAGITALLITTLTLIDRHGHLLLIRVVQRQFKVVFISSILREFQL